MILKAPFRGIAFGCLRLALGTALASIGFCAGAGDAREPLRKPAARSSGILERDGFHLAYQVEGRGLPTLVIGSSIYYPRVFSQGLREHLQMVFLDHRGFVAPPDRIGPSPYELDRILEDIEAVRGHLHLDKVLVMGHSGHALMALEYAKKYPECVMGIVMIGIAPDLSEAGWQASERSWQESVDPERKAVLTENLKRLPDSDLARLPGGERFIRSYVREGPRCWYQPRFDASPLWEGMVINTAMIDYVWGKVFRDIDISRGLAGLDRPVLLALGRYDYTVAPASSWDRLRPHFRSLRVRIFEKSGHTPPLEEPARFDETLLGWMRETLSPYHASTP